MYKTPKLRQVPLSLSSPSKSVTVLLEPFSMPPGARERLGPRCVFLAQIEPRAGIWLILDSDYGQFYKLRMIYWDYDISTVTVLNSLQILSLMDIYAELIVGRRPR